MNQLTWGLQRAAVAVSEEVARSIARRIGSHVRVHVVRNGIVYKNGSLEPSARERIWRDLGIPSSSTVVGTVAVLRAEKRLDLWLKASQEIATHVPDVHFLIVGDGPLRAQLEASARKMSFPQRVHFAGLQECVQPFLAAMDVYMISSEFEGLPLSLLEAMASKLPVVATAVGGIPEVIQDQRSGFVVPFAHTEALADITTRLLEDEVLRRRTGEAARARVIRDFSIDRMMRELETVYASIV
jgi:glycosyltransferase involved in cell wall biosynthesis